MYRAAAECCEEMHKRRRDSERNRPLENPVLLDGGEPDAALSSVRLFLLQTFHLYALQQSLQQPASSLRPAGRTTCIRRNNPQKALKASAEDWLQLCGLGESNRLTQAF